MYECGVPPQYCTCGTSCHIPGRSDEVLASQFMSVNYVDATECRHRYLTEIEGKKIPYVGGYPPVIPSSSVLTETGRLSFTDGMPDTGDALDEWLVNHVTGMVDDDLDLDLWVLPELSQSYKYHYVLTAIEEWGWRIEFQGNQDRLTALLYCDREKPIIVTIPWHGEVYDPTIEDEVTEETKAHAVAWVVWKALIDGGV